MQILLLIIVFMVINNDDLQELLKLTRENNLMLRHIVSYLHRDESTEFIKNVIANLISNRI